VTSAVGAENIGPFGLVAVVDHKRSLDFNQDVYVKRLVARMVYDFIGIIRL
jgi:hypothetical protein